MHLRRGKRGVYKPPAVMHVYHVHKLNLAKRNVHLHLRKGAAERIRVGFYLICAFGCDVPAVVKAVKRCCRKLGKAHKPPAVLYVYYIAVLNVQIVNRHAGKPVRVAQYALLHYARRLLHGKPAHVGLAAGVCARAEGGNVRILGGDYMHLFKRNAQLLRRHLAEGRVRALSYFGFGKLKLHTSILIEHHAAGRAFKRNGPNGGIVPENGHAYAAANIARVVRKFLQLALVIDILHALFDALIKAVEIILVL